MTSPKAAELPVRLFKNDAAWEAWLAREHARSAGLWLRIAKAGSSVESVSYAEALDVALCYGWIDGQKKAFDDATWLQKFTPRGKRSLWSKINREKVQRLVESGRMQPAGLDAVERAKANGQWDSAYESHRTAGVPDDFQRALDANPQARAFFATLNSANRYAILYRIQTVKRAETRARKIEQFIGMLERHEVIH
ncbi:MAG TPA: YdeI/OmpD-associated family protein [Gemmatimonadaceae bacterium]|nr:YdeI/OmpD-associated family protein [Gemmatimonadaceae bacterium]